MTSMSQARTVRALFVPSDEMGAYLVDVVPDVDTIQTLVGGDIEAVSVGRDATMYIHGMGKYAGLELNATANRLLAVSGTPLGLPDDFIVGPAVIFGVSGPDGLNDGDEHDVPASVLDLAARAGVPITPHHTT